MPDFSNLRFSNGDTLIVTRPDGATRDILTVVRRTRTGYLLHANDGTDDRTWPHDEIMSLYVTGSLEHFSVNLQALEQPLSEMLSVAWDSWSPAQRFAARCRETYCLYIDQLLKRGVLRMRAYARAAHTIFKRNREPWTLTANSLAAVTAASINGRRRRSVSIVREDPIARLEQPSVTTLRNWHRRWVSCGRDVRGLVDQYHRRGNFKPRKISKVSFQTDAANPLCVYGAMRYIARTIYLKSKRVSIAYGYRELQKMFGSGIEPVSKTTFHRFIAKHFSDFEEYRARYGAKAAFYRYHLFKRRPAPERPIEEVEVDHTLLDVFVRDTLGRVGRPWLTLLICRATRCIVGIHIGFDVPSFATLQRAIIHAVSPKDLSNVPGIVNTWPCHGVPEFIITDRGREFLSSSFLAAGRDVGFSIVNLPGRCPYLKGAVERFFGTINVRVLSHLEGSTKSRTEGEPPPEKQARLSLADLTHSIVRWIVDDYHQERHEAIGAAPAVRWAELAGLYGVRAIKSFSHLIALMGERTTRKIGSTGIELNNRIYVSPELQELRNRRGGIKRDWEIRLDPYDIGGILVFDDQRWLTVPAAYQETSRGISKYRGRIHLRIARQLVELGETVTQGHLEAAVEIADKAARTGKGSRVLRYGADGALATPVMGNSVLPTILGAKPAIEVQADNETTPVIEPTVGTPAKLSLPSLSHDSEPSLASKAADFSRLLQQRLASRNQGHA